MRTNLAWQNIRSQPRKTVLALAGIGVAIVLMFMQLGFLGAVQNTATQILDRLPFDLLVRSPDYLHLADPDRFDSRWLDDLRGFPDVKSVRTVKVAMSGWQTERGETRGVLLFGIDPNRPAFGEPEWIERVDVLLNDSTVLVDQKSHPDFLPVDGQRFGPGDVGRRIQVGDQGVSIAGLFTLGAGLAANGSLMTSDRTFNQIVRYYGPRDVTFGLIELHPSPEAGAPLRRDLIRDQLKQVDNSYPVDILTRDEVRAYELNRWVGETPIGFIFSLGVAVAVLVGATLVYMILANDVAARMPEYATLRAMGYSGSFLAWTVMKQAWYLAGLAYAPALIVAWGLYILTGAWAGIDLELTGARVALVAGLTLGMCSLSGLLALQKLWQVQPAELF